MQKEEESGYALLDSDPSTCWFSSKNSRFNGKCGAASNKTFGGDWTCSWVEFYTYFRNTPESFTLTCGKYTRHCPEDIRLFASSDGKNYELIYCELGFNKRFNPNQGATTVCRIKADKQKPYKYYRFEGSGNDIDYSFAELTMNYKN